MYVLQLLTFRQPTYISSAYVFWSLFTALIPTLFYFSVWQLSIAGSELALFSVVSPVLLSFAIPSSSTPRTLLDFAKTRQGQVFLQIVSLFGIAAYAVPSPLGRLLLVSAGNSAGMLRQAPLWAGLAEGQEHVGYQAIGMLSEFPIIFGCSCTLSLCSHWIRGTYSRTFQASKQSQ